MARKTAIIIGAGPAGLTAANELIEKTDVKPIVFEMSGYVGGISRTVNYKGNRIDIGGHRFFSKSSMIMDYWQRLMPPQGAPSKDDKALGRTLPVSLNNGGPDPDKEDLVLLYRSRLSRIFFLRKFFDYPLSLNAKMLKNLGLVRAFKIGLSYTAARLFPIREEKNLEDFFINRFGRELYDTFFKNYTEKVWGVPCQKIKPEWGAQRIKGLSVSRALVHAAKNIINRDSSIDQKKTETSLIGQFFYPKFGPGQMWEEMARRVEKGGGEIHLNHEVTKIRFDGGTIRGVEVNDAGNQKRLVEGDYFLSTMPVKDLILAFDSGPGPEVVEVAKGLLYRDFITVGLLLRKMKITNDTAMKTINGLVPDNWIYVQEDDVKVGRLQIFNNWSPYMVRDENTVWMGLEYFCNEGDELWNMDDNALKEFAVAELEKIGLIDSEDALDGVVIRMPKTYPAYFGTYDRFDVLRAFVDQIGNLFLMGRNGMHRYNNMDHSMMTAILAVENIARGETAKENIWSVNIGEEYHETK